eukprot:6468751-Amphidinium_carterae.2
MKLSDWNHCKGLQITLKIDATNLRFYRDFCSSFLRAGQRATEVHHEVSTRPHSPALPQLVASQDTSV